jgi:dipeptidyl aminopeptidase/acylaminoacyl peptidase
VSIIRALHLCLGVAIFLLGAIQGVSDSLSSTLTKLPSAIHLNQAPIDSLLRHVDTWILTDTTRILHYIDSCNAETDRALTRSPHWTSTRERLVDLMGIDWIWMPKPDNTGRIYFLMRITGEIDALFYVDEPMGWPHQLTPNSWAGKGIEIWEYLIHPSGDYLLVFVDVHGDENLDIYRFDRDGTYRPLLVDRNVRYGSARFGTENDVYLIADDGEREHIIQLNALTGDTSFVYQESESIDLSGFHDGKLLCGRWYSFSEVQLFLLDVGMGKVTEIGEIASITDAFSTKDGRVLALSSEKSKPDEYYKYLLFDPKRPHEPTTLYTPGMGVDYYGALVKPLGIVVTKLNSDGVSRLLAFDLSGKLVPVPDVPVGVVGPLYANDSGDIAFTFSSPSMPGTPFLFHLGDTTLTQFGKVATFGFDFSHIDVKVVRYASTDGMLIPALLFVPQTAKRDGRNPAVVIYHGGPPDQSRPYFSRNRSFAMEMGMVMLLPNVRGSEGYTPAYEAADNLEGRFQSLQDCERALDYLVEEGWSSPDKIAIWGGSYGGYVVNWLSVTCPEKFACAISEVGIADVDFNNLHSRTSFLKGWEREMGPVRSELTRRLSPIYRATDVKKPILVTAGFYDRRVPAADPRRWSWLLGRLGKDVLYYEVVEAGHGVTQKTQLIDDLTRQYVFMLSHILPEPRI